MTNYYTVVRYVPDPATEEQLNVGVIAFGDTGAKCRFLHSWKRAEQFAEGDIAFLRDFAAEVSQATGTQLRLPKVGEIDLTPAVVREWSGRWINSLQLSEPKASLLPIDQLAEEMSDRFLREPSRARRGFRDRRVALKAARSGLRTGLRKFPPATAEQLLKSDYKIPGELDEHRFPLALANGGPLLAVEALSFEGVGLRIQKDIDATAWSISDVQKKSPSLLFAVVTLPPKGESRTYARARTVFEGLGAHVVEELDVATWSSEVVPQLVSEDQG